MQSVLITIVVAVVVVTTIFVWQRIFPDPRAEFAPLAIDPADPLMNEAIEEARRSIPHFRELQAQYKAGSVKVPFVTSSGETEFLWAEVLSLVGEQMDINYLTPPVTHVGRLERLSTRAVSDLVDWQVKLPSGKCAGGYTMRVMFVRDREQWGELPPKMAAEEAKYQ